MNKKKLSNGKENLINKVKEALSAASGNMPPNSSQNNINNMPFNPAGPLNPAALSQLFFNNLLLTIDV